MTLRARSAASSPRHRPRLDRLEDRAVPATLDLVNGTLTYAADPGEVNSLSIALVDGKYLFSLGKEVTLGAGAVSAGWTLGDHSVSGPAAGVRNVAVHLGDGDDHVSVGQLTTAASLTFDGGSGSDTFGIGPTYTNPVTEESLTGIVTPGDVTITGFGAVNLSKRVTAGGAVLISTAGSDELLYAYIGQRVGGSSVRILGGAGDDDVFLAFSDYHYPPATTPQLGGAEFPNGLSIDGSAGANSLSLIDYDGVDHVYTAGPGSAARDGTAIGFANVQRVELLGGFGADQFVITPSAALGVEVRGENFDVVERQADALTVLPAGGAAPVVQSVRSETGLSGTVSAAGVQPLVFSRVEEVTPQPLADATLTPNSDAYPGGTVVYTFVLTNRNSFPVGGLSITDVAPAAFAAMSWAATATPGSSVTVAAGNGPVATTADLAPDGQATVIVTATFAADAKITTQNTCCRCGRGPVTYRVQAVAGDTATAAELTFPVRPTARPLTKPTDLIAIGAGAGSEPRVAAYNPDGTLRFSILAYDAGFSGGVHVATADVTGDGVEDVVTGAGDGGGPHVKVFDGVTGRLVREWMAYDSELRGGVWVAAGYIAGDAHADVVTGAGDGGGPHVKVYDGGSGTMVREWMAYETEFRGGVHVATGDMWGDSVVAGSCQTGAAYAVPDGADEVVTGPGVGGAPWVKWFDGRTGELINYYFAYDSDLRGGVFVAVGDIGDVAGHFGATVVTGAGDGGGPHVKVQTSDYANTGLFAFDAALRTGVRVAVADVNADGKADLIAGPGPGTAARAVAFDAATGATLREFAFDPAFQGGIFVG